MDRQRIVITGIGVVAPNGIGKEEFWKNCRAGVSGIKPITLFDVSKYRCRYAGEISNFQPETYLGSKGLRNLDRTTLLALVAAKLAIEDSGLSITDDNRNDIGVVLGSTMGSVHSISEFDKEGLREGPRYVNPAHFPNTVINSPASQVAIRFGLKGLNTTISTGFTASLDAMGYAMDMLELGRANILLVGGVEELCIQTYLGFHKLGLLTAARNGLPPKLNSSSGTVIGEGSAFFMLETENSAKSRKALRRANVLGYGTSFATNKAHRFQPQPHSFVEAIQEAFNQAGLEAKDITEIQRCSNGVRIFDENEDIVLNQVFDRLKPGEAKGTQFWGETFSADGALRIALALDQQSNTSRHVLVGGLSPMGVSSALVLGQASKKPQAKEAKVGGYGTL